MDNCDSLRSSLTPLRRRFGLPESVISRAVEMGSSLSMAGKVKEDMDWTVAADAGERDFPAACEALKSATATKPVIVPANMRPPPSLEGQSCVYLLEIPSEEEGGRSRFYVGETDSFSRRIKAHRSKKEGGMKWKDLGAAVSPLNSGGKSHARMIETSLIKKLSKGGFELISKGDEKNSRFAASA